MDIDIADVGPNISDKSISTLTELARRQIQLQKEVEEAEKALEQKLDALKDIRERALPAAMAQLGVKKFSLTDGSEIEIAQAVKASIPKPFIPQAHDWLEANGHGDMIKRRITILFGRDQIAWAKKFLRDCARRKQPLQLDEKQWVEPQTLMAFVREQRRNAAAEGRDPEQVVPGDLFGVYVQNYARIS